MQLSVGRCWWGPAAIESDGSAPKTSAISAELGRVTSIEVMRSVFIDESQRGICVPWWYVNERIMDDGLISVWAISTPKDILKQLWAREVSLWSILPAPRRARFQC